MKQSFLDTPEKIHSMIASCAIGAVTRGMTRDFSLLYVANISRYNTTRRMASVPFIFLSAVFNSIGPLVGYLIEKIGPRVTMTIGCLLIFTSLIASYFAETIIHIIIFIGICYGSGFGLITNSIPKALTFQFQEHLDKAFGLHLASATVGGLLQVLLLNYLMEEYDLSGTYLILAAVSLHAVPAVMLFRKSIPPKQPRDLKSITTEEANENGKGLHERQRNSKNVEDLRGNSLYCVENSEQNKIFYSCSNKQFQDPDNGTDNKTHKQAQIKSSSSPFSIFLDPLYIFLNISQSASQCVYVVFLTVIVDALMDKGMDREHAVYILIGFTATETFGRAFSGVLTDSQCITRTNFAALCTLLIGLILLLYIWLNGFVMLMILLCIIGICFGGVPAVGVGILRMFVEKHNMSMATASIRLLFGPMSIAQPFIIGYYRDTLKSYRGLFVLLAVVSLVNALMYFVTPVLAKFRDQLRIKKELKAKEDCIEDTRCEQRENECI